MILGALILLTGIVIGYFIPKSNFQQERKNISKLIRTIIKKDAKIIDNSPDVNLDE